MSGAAKKSPRRSSSGLACGTPSSAKAGGPRRRGRNNNDDEEWILDSKNNLWYHRLSAEEHRAWVEEADMEESSLGHVVMVDKESRWALGPVQEMDLAPTSRPLLRSLFLPDALMRLMGMGFGHCVKVENAREGAAKILRAFPTKSGGASAQRILASKDLFQSDGVREGRTLRLSYIKTELSPVVRVSLECEDERVPSLNRVDLELTLRTMLEDCILVEGESLSVNFYGLTLSFRVKELVVNTTRGETSIRDLSSLVTDMSLEGGLKCGIMTAASEIAIASERWRQQMEEQNVPKVDLDQVGGLGAEVARLSKLVRAALFPPEGADLPSTCRGVLLWGPPGTGKTLLGEGIARRLGAQLVRASTADIISKFFGEAEERLKSVFKEAEERQPCVIFLDDLDLLCGRSDQGRAGGQGQEARVTSCLISLLDGVRRRRSRVVLVAATNRVFAIDSRLRSAGRIDTEVELGVPNAEQRLDILKKIIGSADHSGIGGQARLAEVASVCHGYVGSDLQRLLNVALEEADDGQKLNFAHLQAALKQVKPSAMKEVQVEVPSVSWEDIGGLEKLKLALKQAVNWPLERPGAFKRMGIRPPRGVLMYGPPGCSKTMIAKALANESKVNFLSVKGPELFSKWVGESEKAVRDLFRKARQVSPAIVFFDEIDALGSERGGRGGGDVGNRVLAQMLTEMDGIEQLEGVTVVAATNRPDLIDRALMRPGRLDRQFYVPLPDAYTRRKVFVVHTRSKPVAPVFDLDHLVARTEGYSGAEIAAVCNEAGYKALEDSIRGEVENREQLIEMRHFEDALRAVTPRIKKDLLQIYTSFQEVEL